MLEIIADYIVDHIGGLMIMVIVFIIALSTSKNGNSSS